MQHQTRICRNELRTPMKANSLQLRRGFRIHTVVDGSEELLVETCSALCNEDWRLAIDCTQYLRIPYTLFDQIRVVPLSTWEAMSIFGTHETFNIADHFVAQPLSLYNVPRARRTPSPYSRRPSALLLASYYTGFWDLSILLDRSTCPSHDL